MRLPPERPRQPKATREQGFFSPKEAGTDHEAGAFSEDEGIPPRVGFIPDLFVLIPRGGWRQVLPRPGVRGAGQLEPDWAAGCL